MAIVALSALNFGDVTGRLARKSKKGGRSPIRSQIIWAKNNFAIGRGTEDHPCSHLPGLTLADGASWRSRVYNIKVILTFPDVPGSVNY
jgi:hypothetical protein